MKCSKRECRFNLGTSYKIPCDDCRAFLKVQKKKQTPVFIPETPTYKSCRSCEISVDSRHRENGICKNCRERKIYQISTSKSLENNMMYIMIPSTSNKGDITGKGFSGENTQKDVETYISEYLQKKNTKTKICALDVHRVYNTGGAPCDTNHLYLQPLKELGGYSRVLRVLISYMQEGTWYLRTNVQCYAEAAFANDAIDMCVLVFTKVPGKVELPRRGPNGPLIPDKHGTKAGVLLLLQKAFKDVFLTPNVERIGFADDDANKNCRSVRATFSKIKGAKVDVHEIPRIDGACLKNWKESPEELADVRTMIINMINSFSL